MLLICYAVGIIAYINLITLIYKNMNDQDSKAYFYASTIIYLKRKFKETKNKRFALAIRALKKGAKTQGLNINKFI